MQIRDASGTLRTITSLAMRDAGGVLRTIQTGKARDASGVLRTIFSGLKVSASPDNVSGFVYNAGTFPAYTDVCNANIAGGTGPFTYAWTVGGSWSALSPTSPSTSFRSPGLSPGDSDSTTAYVTVTDTSNGRTAASNTVDLNASNIF